MPSSIIASGVPQSNASGHGTQRHVIFATGGAKWWAFWPASTNQVASAYSADGGATWTAATVLTISPLGGDASYSHGGDGRALSVAYARIASTDVIHLTAAGPSQGHTYHFRGTIGATTITWDAGAKIIPTSGAGATTIVPGNTTALATDGRVFDLSPLGSGGGSGNADSNWSTGVDSGTAFSESWQTTDAEVLHATNLDQSTWLGQLAAGAMLAIADNAAGTSYGFQVTNWRWSKFASGAWGALGGAFTNLLGTGLSSGIGANDWGAVVRTATDIHLVYRDSAGGLFHQRWDGAAWASGASIPTQTTKSFSGGFALFSDGTDVWLFALDSTGNNAVVYSKWTSAGGTWAAWQTLLAAGSNARDWLGVAPQGETNGGILVYWTETRTGPAFDLVGIQLGGTPPPPPPPTVFSPTGVTVALAAPSGVTILLPSPPTGVTISLTVPIGSTVKL